jgi:hypothetical protein
MKLLFLGITNQIINQYQTKLYQLYITKMQQPIKIQSELNVTLYLTISSIEWGSNIERHITGETFERGVACQPGTPIE